MKTIYLNGTIRTMAGSETAEALLEENGRILQTGRAADLLGACPAARRFDLQGHALLPGFIDGHSHITALAQTLLLCDLHGAKSFSEIAERLRAFCAARRTAPGEWVMGFGYDPTALAENAHPTAEFLDRALPENPALLTHASGHMGVLNSAAMQALGVTRDSEAPEGGVIGRKPDGTPNGYLEEAAFTQLSARMPRPGAKQTAQSLLAAERIYLENGVTTVQDGLTRAPEWALLTGVREKLTADVVAYVDIACADLLRENAAYADSFRGKLRIGGYKLFLDGSPQGRTAWMTAPYAGETDYRGYPIHTDGEVERCMLKAVRENRQILVHCNGDAAADQMIAAYRKARAACPNNVRPVMVHAQLVRRDQLAEMARLGMLASFFAAHVYHWGDAHLKNFGEKRAAGISPVRTALALGVHCNFHQDSPVLPPDMLETLRCVIERRTKAGVLLGPDERVTPLEALRCMTIGGAYAYFEENEKGTLESGKIADMVVLNRDPAACPAAALGALQVLAPIKNGKTVYQREAK